MAGWETDAHGLVFKSGELKLYQPSHSYGMKLSQLWRQRGILRIMTYSLPDVDYVHEQLGRRPYDVQLLAHEKFRHKGLRIQSEFPGIEVRLLDNMHSKVIAIEPKTLYIGSANFGRSLWHETIIGVRSKEAHDYFVSTSWVNAWNQASHI